MSYDVLNDDLYKESSKKEKKKKKSLLSFNPIYLQFALLLLLIVLIGFYFTTDKQTNYKNTFSFVGGIENFSQSYSRNLIVESKEYLLEVPNGKFDGRSETFNLYNFTGKMFEDNNTIKLVGKASKITFSSNELNVNKEQFTLESKKKTKLYLFFETLPLQLYSGTLKLNEELSLEYDNASISFENINGTLAYDGKYSFIGSVNSFDLYLKDLGLDITYSFLNESS